MTSLQADLDRIAPVRIWDKGPRPVLALHCSLAHAGAFSALARALTGVRLVAMDQVGHGRAPDWDGQEDLHLRSFNEAVALAERMGGPVDVIGHSFGGTVALRLALRHPGLVRSLTLVEPVLFAAARAAGHPAFDQYMASHMPFEGLVRRGDRQAAAQLFNEMWGAGEPFDALPDKARADILSRIHLILPQHPFTFDDAAGMLHPGVLEGFSAPTLLLEGSHSPDVVGAIQSELARRLPKARRRVIEGAGHMLPLTHAAEVAAAIQTHLNAT